METLLRRLVEIEGVLGVLLVGKDGLLIASLMDAARAEMHAALVAPAFDALAGYTRQVGAGSTRLVMLQTPSAAIVIAEAGDMLVVVEATADAALERIRLEATQTARAVLDQLRG